MENSNNPKLIKIKRKLKRLNKEFYSLVEVNGGKYAK